MGPTSFLQAAPLATASIWWGLVAYLAARDRFRTWTEVLVLALCGSLGGFALSDVFFLNATTPEAAEAAARMSLSFLSAAAAAFVLFAFVLGDRMRPQIALLLLPAAGAIALAETRLIAGAVSAADVGLPYRAMYDPLVLDVWVVYALVYAGVALGLLWRVFARMRRHAAGAARRLRLLLFALLLAVFSGASTNLVAALFGLHLPPLFSTLLAVPGVLAFAALAPASELPFLEAAARWKSPSYRVRASFLTYEDGTLIGRRIRPGGPAVDADLFGATLDVIQNFMHTSFPALGSAWLRSVAQGDYTLVLERGEHACLILVLEGKENDQLRRLMRDAIRTYERANWDVLARWKGEAASARGTDEMLDRFLEG